MAVITGTQLPAWQEWAQKSPLSCALKTPEKNYSWSVLCEEITACASGLKAQGVKPGDTILLVGKNKPELLILYLACLECGAVAALAMPQPAKTLKLKLQTLYPESVPAKIWLTDSVRETLSKEDLASLNAIFLTYQSDKWKRSQTDFSAYKAEQIASIVFTSGSTGYPKAVAHTSRQHFASAGGLLEKFCYTAEDTWLLSLPLYHVSGLAIVYRWLYAGGCLKVGNGTLAEDISGVTHASLVATQLQRLLDSDSKLVLNHVLLGGGHIPVELAHRASGCGIETWIGYGMTEAASTVTAKQTDNRNTAGFVLPNRKVKLVGQNVFIGGDTLAEGYYYQGKLTPITDSDGWFDTRDLAKWQGEELKVIGRADNQFISGGENIHCEEIEAVLNRHPKIRQVIILPVENKEYGFRPVAIVQCDMSPEELDLKRWLADKLVKFKIPDAFYPMPVLSKGNIKISRAELKAWYRREVQLQK